MHAGDSVWWHCDMAEHYERTWANRFQVQDLNETGRRGLGLA